MASRNMIVAAKQVEETIPEQYDLNSNGFPDPSRSEITNKIIRQLDKLSTNELIYISTLIHGLFNA